MTGGNNIRTIANAHATGSSTLHLEWSDGTNAVFDLPSTSDALWLETLSAIGHGDARAFLEKKVPKSILLACRGWEVGEAA